MGCVLTTISSFIACSCPSFGRLKETIALDVMPFSRNCQPRSTLQSAWEANGEAEEGGNVVDPCALKVCNHTIS